MTKSSLELIKIKQALGDKVQAGTATKLERDTWRGMDAAIKEARAAEAKYRPFKMKPYGNFPGHIGRSNTAGRE